MMNNAALETTEGAISDSSKRPKVIANFSDYSPPFDPVPVVEKMLASVPAKYLIGLSEIVLTNSSGLSRQRRRSTTRSRKRKVKIVEAHGLYHAAWNGDRAWVEIFVDNTLMHWEKGWWLSFGFLRESLLGNVLFHEIGHHIHATVQPEFREREDVADIWMVRLRLEYGRVQYPWLKVILYPFRPIVRTLCNWAYRREFSQGLISRGEFEERLKKPVRTEK